MTSNPGEQNGAYQGHRVRAQPKAAHKDRRVRAGGYASTISADSEKRAFGLLGDCSARAQRILGRKLTAEADLMRIGAKANALAERTMQEAASFLQVLEIKEGESAAELNATQALESFDIMHSIRATPDEHRDQTGYWILSIALIETIFSSMILRDAMGRQEALGIAITFSAVSVAIAFFIIRVPYSFLCTALHTTPQKILIDPTQRKLERINRWRRGILLVPGALLLLIASLVWLVVALAYARLREIETIFGQDTIAPPVQELAPTALQALGVPATVPGWALFFLSCISFAAMVYKFAVSCTHFKGRHRFLRAVRHAAKNHARDRAGAKRRLKLLRYLNLGRLAWLQAGAKRAFRRLNRYRIAARTLSSSYAGVIVTLRHARYSSMVDERDGLQQAGAPEATLDEVTQATAPLAAESDRAWLIELSKWQNKTLYQRVCGAITAARAKIEGLAIDIAIPDVDHNKDDDQRTMEGTAWASTGPGHTTAEDSTKRADQTGRDWSTFSV